MGIYPIYACRIGTPSPSQPNFRGNARRTSLGASWGRDGVRKNEITVNGAKATFARRDGRDVISVSGKALVEATCPAWGDRDSRETGRAGASNNPGDWGNRLHRRTRRVRTGPIPNGKQEAAPQRPVADRSELPFAHSTPYSRIISDHLPQRLWTRWVGENAPASSISRSVSKSLLRW